MTYYIYELVDPRDNAIFYIGKGKRYRIDNHEKEARRGGYSRKCERIRSIEADGLSIIKRQVAWFTDERAAYDAEAARIEEIGLDNLTNVVAGGGGVPVKPKELGWTLKLLKKAGPNELRRAVLFLNAGKRIWLILPSGKIEFTESIRDWVQTAVDKFGEAAVLAEVNRGRAG